jgi:hypothetical protein
LFGKIPPGARSVDVSAFTPPDSLFARQAEEECREQPLELVGHAYRTWLFGQVLAAVDGEVLDHELFYVASLLHDYGLAHPTPGRDFTLLSAERALQCAQVSETEAGLGSRLADAICVHSTPGISIDRDGELGCYVQWGAMADIVGLRLWDISKNNIDEIIHRHPRDGFKKQITTLIRAEADAVPNGRFGLLVRSGVPLAIRLAPFES